MFFRQRRIRSFHVVVLQRTTEKCTKHYNARAQLLFSSLNLLFRNVLVSVVLLLNFLMLNIEGDIRVFYK